MQIPKSAIEKAIEGGWRDKISDNGIIKYLEMEEAHTAVALDPTFWASLGKALGWHKIAHHYHANLKSFNDRCLDCNAHRFYDLILNGEDTTNFWTDLLNQ